MYLVFFRATWTFLFFTKKNSSAVWLFAHERLTEQTSRACSWENTCFPAKTSFGLNAGMEKATKSEFGRKFGSKRSTGAGLDKVYSCRREGKDSYHQENSKRDGNLIYVQGGIAQKLETVFVIATDADKREEKNTDRHTRERMIDGYGFPFFIFRFASVSPVISCCYY